jgi:hypothetical protein
VLMTATSSPEGDAGMNLLGKAMTRSVKYTASI